MPTYSYVCKACGHAFDIQQAFTDDALTSCPECDGALRKVFSAVGVVFKGSGFYRNDSRSSEKSSATSGSSSSETTSGKASEKTPARTDRTAEKKSESTPPAASSTSSASTPSPSPTTS